MQHFLPKLFQIKEVAVNSERTEKSTCILISETRELIIGVMCISINQNHTKCFSDFYVKILIAISRPYFYTQQSDWLRCFFVFLQWYFDLFNLIPNWNIEFYPQSLTAPSKSTTKTIKNVIELLLGIRFQKFSEMTSKKMKTPFFPNFCPFYSPSVQFL